MFEMVKLYNIILMYIVTTLKGIANMTIDQLMIQFLEVHINQTICPLNLFINSTYQAFHLKINT